MRESSDARGTLLRRFFAGATEYAFAVRLGVADPPLVDYLSELLLRFVRNDAIFGMRSPTGQRLSQVADMLAEAQARQGPAKRIVHRHIGDFTLFWSGVFPEIAEQNRRAGEKDSLLDYRDQGKRNYYIASTLPKSEQSAPDDVLTRLSENFELCVYGLGEVRKQWQDREDENDPLFLL
ncbi:hypothetical protein OAS39_03970 [Pirellulales bacterium]|nr:hypothetical protein [Pirellulales bacterium]